MILVLDNYDSFTHNLVALLRQHGDEVRVIRSDAAVVDDVLALEPARIVISPGPGRPEERGIAVDLVRRAAGRIPILGVCLGLQAIGLAFGAQLERAPAPVHGKTSLVRHDGRGVLAAMPDPFRAMRYHSLVLAPRSLPEVLEVSATVLGEPELVMGLRHRRYAVEGVQFHPESFLTEGGERIIESFCATREPAVA